jgi:anti-anti-sigma factor
MVSNLTVNVKEVEARPALIVQVVGSIDSSQDLEAISRIIESSDRKLFLLSMAGVDYINSAGVGEIIAMSHSAKELGKKVCFSGMHPYVREVFELLGGHYFVPIYNSEQEALAAE